MATETRDTITYEEFEKRLEASNQRLQKELEEAQDRVRQMEALIERKEIFSHHLTEVLTEIKREENEIAAMEKGLYLSRRPAHCGPAGKTQP